MKELLLLKTKFLLFFVVIIMLSAMQTFCQVIPLPHAYAHNDYWHKHPLFDALGNGFTHVEADVYLRHSKLLVAHKPPLLRKHNTIEDLYLKPLYNRFINNSGNVQTSMDTIVLMVDIKSNAEKTYLALKELLKDYEPILSTCDNGKVVIRNLTVVLTGHRPLELLNTETSRLVFADEDLRKININEKSPDMFTIASCKYSNLIKWKGKGTISEFEKNRLKSLVVKAHLLGEKVRLWASPEKEKVWVQLRNCGVDLINTDKLVALKRFFIRDISIHTIDGEF